MVVGFNHNFRYNGIVFHVQTEDGGLNSPHIITLLYNGGTILTSKKTSYADIVKVDNLEKVVEELMKEQHRDMLRRLKVGELDDLIRARLGSKGGPSPQKSTEAPQVERQKVAPPKPDPPPSAPAEKKSEEEDLDASLDDIILSYLLGDAGKKL